MPEFGAPKGFIKICGVTTVRDAESVVTAGADALGLILTSSRRRVDPRRAREIAEVVGDRLVRVAVVRGAASGEVLELVSDLDVDAVQIHDTLDDDLLAALRGRGLAVIKALSVGSTDFEQFDESRVDAILVDGPVPGSGQSHSWADLARRSFDRPVIGAGGLTPENVGELIDGTAVSGVDVATGVESAPGVKDVSRVVDFVNEARDHFTRRRSDRD